MERTNPHRNTLARLNEGLSNCSHEWRARSDWNTDDAINGFVSREYEGNLRQLKLSKDKLQWALVATCHPLLPPGKATCHPLPPPDKATDHTLPPPDKATCHPLPPPDKVIMLIQTE